MSACSKCNCSPCACSPAVFNQPQIVGGVLDGSTLNGPTINGGQATNLTLNGAQLDCTSRVCTQPPGICDGSIASTAFVCTAISNAITSGNPALCTAVIECVSAEAESLCPMVFTCINTTDGIINTVNAFGPGSYATQADWGVTRYATKSELEQAICGVSFEPCTLREFWLMPNVSSPLWMAFASAVGMASGAVLNNAVLTGIPTAPTAAAGTCTNQIATTSFVCTAITNAISASNPAFCAAVAACSGGGSCSDITNLFADAGGAPGAGVRFLADDCQKYTSAQISGGGGGGVTLVCYAVGMAWSSTAFDLGDCTQNTQQPLFSFGCTVQGNQSNPTGASWVVTFNTPQPDANYAVLMSGGGTVGFNVTGRTAAGFTLSNVLCATSSGNVDFAVIRS